MDSALRRAQESPLLIVEKRELLCYLELDGAMLRSRTIRVKLKLSMNDIQSSNRTCRNVLFDRLREPALHRVRQHDRIGDVAHRFTPLLALPLQHCIGSLLADLEFLLEDSLRPLHQLA